MFKTLCVFGTRPEAIKMAPIIQQLKSINFIENKNCITGQHQQMLKSVIDIFSINIDFNLNVMEENQSLSSLTAKILIKLDEVYLGYKPDLILVHGDTTTTLAASIAAYYHHIPVAHVEAGLRTGNINSPWPEEINRKLTASIAILHFAPTELSKTNLLNEGINPSLIQVTGNTVIDALYFIKNKLNLDIQLYNNIQQKFEYLAPERRLILVTGHRRENFGQGFANICQALVDIAQLYPDVNIVYPVHLNPNVQKPVKSILGTVSNIYLIDPIDYVSCVYLMQKSYLILTDSGGIQEEAPSLGKPVLVMRNTTERPEALQAGVVKLVGINIKDIVHNVSQLLNNNELYAKMSQAQNPYGDGMAAIRIVNIIKGRALRVI